MAHSIEVRRRAIEAYLNGGGSYAYLSSLWQIGSASLKRWVWRKQKTGEDCPEPHGGGVDPRIDDRGLQWLKAALEEKNDATLEELRSRYCSHFRKDLSVATIGRAVRDRLGWPRKKKRTVRHNETRKAHRR